MAATPGMNLPTLRLGNIRLGNGHAVAIDIEGDRIQAVHRADAAPAVPGVAVEDGGGGIVMPSFVEGHIHLDKTLLGLPLIPHRPGATVRDRVRIEKAIRRDLTLSVEQRGGRLVEQVAAFGTGTLRTHVDIDTELGLSGLEAVLRLRHAMADLVDMQVVAFPQSGILADPGTAALLEEAVRQGADLVGGLDPAGFDGDMACHLDAVFGIATRQGCGVDIHLHDPGALGAFELRDIAARTRAAGLAGRVAVSHAYALGAVDDGDFGRTAEALAEAGVSIMTNAPGTGAMPPVLRLAAAGVRVFAGSDNIRDAWWPYGNGDMLDRAGVIGYRQGLFTIPELEHAAAMATTLAADALGLDGYGLEPGCRADLVVLPSGSVAEAVLDRPASRTVLKQGRVIARGESLLPRS